MKNFIKELQLLVLSLLFINVNQNTFSNGFSWIGLGLFIFGNAFVLTILYLRNQQEVCEK